MKAKIAPGVLCYVKGNGSWANAVVEVLKLASPHEYVQLSESNSPVWWVRARKEISYPLYNSVTKQPTGASKVSSERTLSEDYLVPITGLPEEALKEEEHTPKQESL